MNFASILSLLLQTVYLLSSASASGNEQAKLQALNFANQAIAIATVAMNTHPTSSLVDVVSTSTAPVVPILSLPVVQTSTPSVPEIGGTEDTGAVVATTTEVIAPVVVTPTPASTPVVVTPSVHRIEVTLSTSSDGFVYVKVKNTANGLLQESIVINFLNVPGGTLVAYRIPGESIDFRPCPTFCDGIIIGNEMTATLRYEGSPTEVIYDPKSISGKITGNDIVW